jgi:hypothetical protein
MPACSILLLLKQTASLDVTIEMYTESPGLYYDDARTAQLYNKQWKVVTYVNLDEADQNLEMVKKYGRFSINFSKQHEYTFSINYTACMKTIKYLDRQIEELENMETTHKTVN